MYTPLTLVVSNHNADKQREQSHRSQSAMSSHWQMTADNATCQMCHPADISSMWHQRPSQVIRKQQTIKHMNQLTNLSFYNLLHHSL